MEEMTHNTQLLIATEKERWLKLHLEGGLTITELSKRSGFSRDTLHRWKNEYAKHGLQGLVEKSRAHHFHPKTTSFAVVEMIRSLREEKPVLGAKKIAPRLKKRYEVNIPWRTVHRVLKREGLVKTRKRLPTKKKWAKKPLVPGELVQVDVAYARKYKGKWLYQFTSIDGYSRWRYVEIFKEQNNGTALLFLQHLIIQAPFRITGIQTDNGSIFTNRYVGYSKSTDPLRPKLHVFDRFCIKHGITHYLIDPGKPAQNGKVERSHRTDREEFWRGVRFRTLPELKQKHATYMAWHNNEREHLGIDGLTPKEKLEMCQI
jgi:transposase InsO family protein